MIEIIPYTKVYQDVFKRLNMEWLEKYNLVESHDLEILNDPDGTVIVRGGLIFLAKDGENIVGSAGLYKQDQKTFELIKMAVDPAQRGLGTGQMLLNHCLKTAKDRGAEKVILFSNSQLKSAIHLYEKYGFRHVDVSDAPFETADVKMELILS
jgi:ribosomal protein S18 acetylase RimI-like enzyme